MEGVQRLLPPDHLDHPAEAGGLSPAHTAQQFPDRFPPVPVFRESRPFVPAPVEVQRGEGEKPFPAVRFFRRPQHRHQVPDVVPLQPAAGGGDGKRDFRPQQQVGGQVGREVIPVEDTKRFAPLQPGDRLQHLFHRLQTAFGVEGSDRLRPALPGGAEGLVVPLGGEGDKLPAPGEDLRPGAEVFLHPDDLSGGEIAGKLQNPFGAGPAEAVDRLVFVADHEQPLPFGGEQPQHRELDRRDVLALVDVDIRVAAAEPVPQPRQLFEEGVGVEENVVVVHQPPL